MTRRYRRGPWTCEQRLDLTMSTNLSDMTIEELKEKRDAISDSDLEDRTGVIDDELADREEARSQEKELLDLKIALKEAEQAGLSDDPTVESLKEEVEELEAALHDDPHEDLASLDFVEEEAARALSETEATEALSHAEALRDAKTTMESRGSTPTMVEHSIRARQQKLSDLVAGNRKASVEALSPPGVYNEALEEED